MNTLRTSRIGAAVAAILTMSAVVASSAPASADGLSDLFNKAQGRQQDKNNMRNLGVGLGAVSAYELLHGQTGPGLVLGAGAAYAAKKYEDERKTQSQYSAGDRSWSRHYVYHNGTRVGYDLYHNGHRVSYYSRGRDSDGHFGSSYNWSRNY